MTTRQASALLLPSLFLLLPQGSHAQDRIVLNGVRPWVGTTGVTEIYPSQVTLFNAGQTSVDLGSWTLRAEGDTSLVLPLPAMILSPGAYLVVNFGPAPDTDFVLGGTNAVYTPPGEVGVLFPEAGEVGLYDGVQIADFVAGGIDATTQGSSYLDAVAAGQWPAGQYVDSIDFFAFSHLARIPSGYDTDAVSDWQEAHRQISFPVEAHNDVQVGPPHGTFFAEPDTLFWRDVPDASGYTLQVATDTLFTTIILDTLLTTTELAGHDFPDDTWLHWRVLPVLPGGPWPASVWSFHVLGAGTALRSAMTTAAPPQPQINLAHRVQHKDTKMLCLWDLGVQKIPALQKKLLLRHGCAANPTPRDPSGPWRDAHAQTADHVFRCAHCNMYCTRASFQMINNHFNGTLTQDEISYHMKRDENPGPEGDLGHRMGEANQQTLLATLRWAMSDNNGVQLAQAADNSFVQIGNEIAAMRPIAVGLTSRLGVEGTESHCIVVNGYLPITPQRPVPFLYISDPLPDTKMIRRTGWYAYTALRARFYFTLPMGPQGRAGNALVGADADSDGVVDFDEGLLANGQLDPARRNLHARADVADTDGDGIADRFDIGSYTFHAGFHPAHPKPLNQPSPIQRLDFPDVDNDGRRAENDTDSDGDGFADGVEDCNQNAASPETNPNPPCAMGATETCVYDPDSHPEPVAVALQAFEATSGDEEVVLHWRVAGDPAYAFDIQRDARHVATVPGQEGTGPYTWVDQGLVSGRRHTYRLFEREPSGEMRLLAEQAVTVGTPYRCQLHPVHPNPFNPSATIRFEVPDRGHVHIELVDVAGRRARTILDEVVPAGRHHRNIDVGDLASGVYLLQLRAGRHVRTQKVVVLR